MSPTYNRQTVLQLGAGALAALGTAGCLNGQSSPTQTVRMSEGFTFDPETATGATGGTVSGPNWPVRTGLRRQAPNSGPDDAAPLPAHTVAVT